MLSKSSFESGQRPTRPSGDFVLVPAFRPGSLSLCGALAEPGGQVRELFRSELGFPDAGEHQIADGCAGSGDYQLIRSLGAVVAVPLVSVAWSVYSELHTKDAPVVGELPRYNAAEKG